MMFSSSPLGVATVYAVGIIYCKHHVFAGKDEDHLCLVDSKVLNDMEKDKLAKNNVFEMLCNGSETTAEPGVQT
jgi:hypothetical protein